MQYRDLISTDEYLEYIKAHTDLDGILDVHRWLSIRYCVYFPYRKGEKDWYFLFLMGSKVPSNHAMNMLEDLRKYPLILFGSLENKIYG